MAFGNADAYARFMGRFSEPLAQKFADLVDPADVADGRVLDVGCGPGVLTAVLVERFGADRVDAVDPTPGFVAAARARLPQVDVREGAAEALPAGDGTYAASYAQLVVPFMKDPVRGLTEMARVTRPGGTVAACVWDHGGERGPLSLFWESAKELDPSARRDADDSAGSTAGDLERLMGAAGLVDVRGGQLSVTIHLASFEDWWAPFEEPAGSAGDYLATPSPHHNTQLPEHLPPQISGRPLDLTVWTWTGTGHSSPSRG